MLAMLYEDRLLKVYSVTNIWMCLEYNFFRLDLMPGYYCHGRREAAKASLLTTVIIACYFTLHMNANDYFIMW